MASDITIEGSPSTAPEPEQTPPPTTQQSSTNEPSSPQQAPSPSSPHPKESPCCSSSASASSKLKSKRPTQLPSTREAVILERQRQTERRMRRNNHAASGLPMERLAHRLSKHSLRHPDASPAPTRRSPSAAGITPPSPAHTPQRPPSCAPDDIVNSPCWPEDVPMLDVLPLSRRPMSFPTQIPTSVPSSASASSLLPVRHSYVGGVPSTVTLLSCPPLEPDEGYCEGEDDFSWLASDELALPAVIPRRGVLRFHTSQEAAMQSSNLVRNQTRIRRRRLKRHSTRSVASSIYSESNAPDSPVLSAAPSPTYAPVASPV